MTAMLQLIDELEEDIFAFHIDTAMQKVSAITEKVINISGHLDSTLLPDLMNIINHVNYALDNKDYLFLIDLLQHELKPFMASLSLPQMEN